MNKRGNTTWIVVSIIIGIIFILILALGFVFLRDKISPSGSSEVKYMKIYIRSLESKNQTVSDYFVDYSQGLNSVILSNGKLSEDSYTEVLNIPQDQEIYVTCLSDQYYSDRKLKIFSQTELDLNSSKLDCNLKKIGNLTIKYSGGLNDIENRIELNISSDKFFQGLSMAFSWTAGIVDVSIDQMSKTCGTEWKNYTKFNETNGEYLYLDNSSYQCDGKIENCKSIDGLNCVLSDEKIPNRFLGQVDYAFYTGKDINNETYKLNINVKTTEDKNSFDYLKIIFYDKDLRYTGTRWEYVSELGGKDISAKDKEVIIKYG